jgi:hypothetical protein
MMQIKFHLFLQPSEAEVTSGMREFFMLAPSTEDRDQMAKLAVDVFGLADGVGNLCA